MIRRAGFVVYLLAVWLLLWGEVSVGNVVSGLLVTALLLLVFPRAPGSTGFVIRPLPTARFALFFAREMVGSAVLLSRVVVSRESHVHTGVITVPVFGCRGSMLAVMANLIALTPGTVAVEMREEPTTLYIHVLIFQDIESMRLKVQQLNRLVVLAFAAAEDRAVFLEPKP